MAKVLISFLGAGALRTKTEGEIESEGRYKEVDYFFDMEQIIYKSSFVSKVLIEKIKPKKIIIFGTSKSMWDELYYTYRQENNFNEEFWLELFNKQRESSYKYYKITEKDLKKVSTTIKNYFSINNVYLKLVKYGVNEEEQKKNFDIILRVLLQLIEKNDEIYLDITHSFRSIPFFTYIIFNLFETLKIKNIKIKGIYYGMLDMITEVKKAPIVDLSTVWEYSKWTNGFSDFLNYGNYKNLKPILNTNTKLGKLLKEFSDAANSNMYTDLRKIIKKLDSELEKTEKENGDRITIFFIFEAELRNMVNYFNKIESEYLFLIKLSKWYYQHEKYVNAYISLSEGIITFYGEENEIPNYNNYSVRGEIIKNYINKDKIKKVFWEIKNKRNFLVHATENEKEYSFNNIIDLFPKHYNEVCRKLGIGDEL